MLRFAWKERVEYRVRLGPYALRGEGRVSSRARQTGPTNRATVRLPTRANTSDSEKAFPIKHVEQERANEREKEIHTCTRPHRCACNLEIEGDSPVSDGRTYRPGTKETRGASMASSTPGISLIRLGTRFECSLSLSTTSSLSKSVCSRARSSMRNFRTVWHTWVAITRVPFESTRELVVGSELARGSLAYGYGDCS